jgi:hypothetical protein
MRWWFRESRHNVKIVLAKFDDRRQNIVIERWEEEMSWPQGAMTRSRAAAVQQDGLLQPVKQQTIIISRNTTTNPVSYDVVRDPLVLRFRLLFLRDLGPQEGDILIGTQQLQVYADRVWVHRG